MIALLKEDIVLYSDGGGKKAAAKIPLVGKMVCRKFLLGLFNKFGDQLTVAYLLVNGMAALQLTTREGALDSIVYFTILEGQIDTIYIIRNPDKLVVQDKSS